MVNRSQLVFVNSKQRLTGQPYEFTLNFNDGLLKAEKGCFMRLTVEEATINRSWYSIQEGSNSFDLVDSYNNITPIVFPIAYYNAVDIRTTLAGLLPAGWTTTYDRKTNKFTITRGNDSTPSYKFVFTNGLNEVLGFRAGEEPTYTIANPSVTSTIPIRVNEENAVCIHSDMPRSKFSSMDNHDTSNKSFKESSIICKIPIQCAPFDNVVYLVQSPMFVFDITANNISTVRFWVTDENDRVLQLPYDWSMTFNIEHIAVSSGREPLEDMRDYLKLMVLSNEKLISS
jgi:hypothetical protein